jgi:hypothetical protein
LLRPAALLPFLFVAAAATPAAAQNNVGTLDDLQKAHQLCYKATEGKEVDRSVVTDRGWDFVTLTSADGTRQESDQIYFHQENHSLIVMPLSNDHCVARTLVNDESLLERYLSALQSYAPELVGGRYMFCAEGRVAGLEQISETSGPVIQVYLSTQVETGRCLSS